MRKPGTSIRCFLILAVAACAPSPGPASGFEPAGADEPSAVTALMLRHYDRARALTSAVIFGNADGAHAAAAAILREEPSATLPEALDNERAAFVAAVRGVEAASDPVALSSAAATMARRCGDCHLAAGLGPSFSVGRVVDPVTPEDHIRVLAWGSSRMWEGMVGGSDLSWRAGARALSGQLLREDLYVSVVSDPAEGRVLSTRLHDLGVQALSSSTAEERSRVLGEIWGTCSGCHAMIDSGA